MNNANARIKKRVRSQHRYYPAVRASLMEKNADVNEWVEQASQMLMTALISQTMVADALNSVEIIPKKRSLLQRIFGI